MTQPSQIRSIKYLEKTFSNYLSLNKEVSPQVISVESVRMYGIPKMSSNYFRPFIELYNVRSGDMIYTTKDQSGKNRKYKIEDDGKVPIDIQFHNCPSVAGDVLFRVYHTGNINVSFLFQLL